MNDDYRLIYIERDIEKLKKENQELKREIRLLKRGLINSGGLCDE